MNQIKTTPKDFFLHLTATVVLYTAVIALINLSFSIINYFFPDALAGYFYANSVAWPISMLVVLVPVLYVVEWLIEKDIKAVPEKKELWVRRWRIYLTLFLAGAVIVGDFITLINTYLAGEISIRFFLKVIAILLITGTVFKYYFFSLHENHKWAKMSLKFHKWFGAALVIIAVVLGFITVGSPSKQRSMRFDSQRVSDLQNIQWQIVNHWQQKGVLPANLEALKDPISGVVIPNDPETDMPYEYTMKGTTSFELCANFDLTSEDTQGRGEYGYGGGIAYRDMSVAYPAMDGNDNWKHEAGRVCFDRSIDPERYPVFKKEPINVTMPTI